MTPLSPRGSPVGKGGGGREKEGGREGRRAGKNREKVEGREGEKERRGEERERVGGCVCVCVREREKGRKTHVKQRSTCIHTYM